MSAALVDAFEAAIDHLHVPAPEGWQAELMRIREDLEAVDGPDWLFFEECLQVVPLAHFAFPPMDVLLAVLQGELMVDHAEVSELLDGSAYPPRAQELFEAVHVLPIGAAPEGTQTPEVVVLREKDDSAERIHLVTPDAVSTFPDPRAVLRALVGKDPQST